MRVATTFDPSAQASGSFNTQIPVGGGGRFVAWNDSAISMTFTLPNGDTANAPAGQARLFRINGPNQIVQWAQRVVIPASGGAPVSECVIEVYEDDEEILETFPQPIQRITSVGNPLNVASSASSITNDGNPAATSVVEATVAGDASSAVKLTNDGNLVLGNSMRNASVTAHKFNGLTNGNVEELMQLNATDGTTNIFNNGATAATNIVASFGGYAVSFDDGGDMLFSGRFGVNATADSFDASSGNKTVIKARNAGGKILFQVNGVNVASIDGSGNMKLLGSVTQNTTP